MKNQGQTLVMLLVFVTISVIIISGSIAIILSNTLGATEIQQGMIARQVAESGIEDALLRLIRDPAFSTETLPVGEGTAAVTVTGSDTNKTLQSIGTVGDFQRKIIVKITYNDYVYSIISWQEIQ